MTHEKNNFHQLPKGWISTQLGEIAEIILGQSPPSSTYNESGNGLPFYQGKLEFGKIYPTPKKWCAAPKKMAEKGDVLISVRAPVGPTNICPEKSCIGRGLAAIHGLGGIETSLILYLIRTFENGLAGKGTGTTFNAISGHQLKGFEIPLPPLPEQHRIVAKIEELFTNLDAGVESLKKVKAQLKRYRQAVLKYAFEGKLTEEWRKTHKDQREPASVLTDRTSFSRKQIKEERKKSGRREYVEYPPLNTEELPKLPEGWSWTRVGEVINIVDYRGRTPPFSPDGVPHLRSSNIKNGRIIWSDLRFVSKETYARYMTRGLSQEGDVIFTSEAPLGEVALAPEREFSIAQRLMVLRPIKDILHPKFLLYQIMSERFQMRLKGKGTGSTVTGVSSRNFVPLELAIAPLIEQTRIIEEIEAGFSVADEVEKTVTQGSEQAERLRQSILKQAFEGKLLPRDPSDEPAEKLLERIKKEKVKHRNERNTRNESRGSAPKQVELVRYVK